MERLARESQLFSELQASRYRFMAYFGEEAAKPFDELRKIHKEVLDAADSLARADQPGDGASPSDRAAWNAAIGRGAHPGRTNWPRASIARYARSSGFAGR